MCIRDRHNFETSTQEKWTSLIYILKESAKVNLGYKKPKQKSENDDIMMISIMQRAVQKQIESNSDDCLKNRLKRYRNRLLTEIHRERKQEENEKIRSNMKSLENNQDDNQKMYDAMRQINKMKPKTPLAVSSKDDQTTDKVE